MFRRTVLPLTNSDIVKLGLKGRLESPSVNEDASMYIEGQMDSGFIGTHRFIILTEHFHTQKIPLLQFDHNFYKTSQIVTSYYENPKFPTLSTKFHQNFNIFSRKKNPKFLYDSTKDDKIK